MSFSQRLKLLFVVTNAKQSEIAARLEVQPNRITKWLQGLGEPGPGQLGQLAAAFDVPPNYFTDRIGPRLAEAIGIPADRLVTVEHRHRAKCRLPE